MPSPDNRSAGAGAARKSPPRSWGRSAPERAWSSASRCPSTAAIPPADTSTVMTTSHLVTPGVVIYNAAVIASDNVLEVDADYVLSTCTVDRGRSDQRRPGLHSGHARSQGRHV